MKPQVFMNDTDIYFGSELTTAECELIALRRLTPELREAEAELFETKWFDFRVLHPIKATYLFAHHYQLAVQRMYAKTRDVEEAKTIRAFTPEDVFESTEATAFWRARQAFDSVGVRYDVGLDFAFARANDRGWSYMPRPNQLYGPEFLTDLRDYWNTLCREVYQRTRHPRFGPGTYEGHPDQEAHRRWMLEQVKKRQEPRPLLASLIKDGLIPETLAASVFGEDYVSEAKRFLA